MRRPGDVILIAIVTLISTGSALGYGFGTDITIPDTVYQVGDTTGWYGSGFVPPYGHADDHEMEPGNLTGQQWDLEAYFLDESKLTVVGGFDFIDGQQGYNIGGIFIDIDGDAQWGYGNTSPGASGNGPIFGYNYGYDYVVDFNFDHFTYDIYNIMDESNLILVSVTSTQNITSNPWEYYSGGVRVDNGGIAYFTGLSDDDNLTGGYHNALTVDLDAIFADMGSSLGIDIDSDGASMLFHLTLQNGCDNLMGATEITPTIPEPSTLLLMSTGLMSLAGIQRKRR